MYFGSNINRLPDELGIKREANKGIKDYFQIFGMSNCGAISLRWKDRGGTEIWGKVDRKLCFDYVVWDAFQIWKENVKLDKWNWSLEEKSELVT